MKHIKKIILGLFIAGFLVAAGGTRLDSYGFYNIYDGALSTADTTNGAPCVMRDGIATLWFEGSDSSTVTLSMQLYNKRTKNWGDVSGGASSVSVSVLSTPVYVNIKSAFGDDWTVADSVRFILGGTDSNLIIDYMIE